MRQRLAQHLRLARETRCDVEVALTGGVLVEGRVMEIVGEAEIEAVRVDGNGAVTWCDAAAVIAVTVSDGAGR